MHSMPLQINQWFPSHRHNGLGPFQNLNFPFKVAKIKKTDPMLFLNPLYVQEFVILI